MAEVEEKIEEEVQLPKGRAAFLEKYKQQNPDATEEVTDEDLWNDAHARHSDLESRYGELSGANTRLSGLVGKDPKLAGVLAMLSGDKPKSLPYAVASVYGKDFLDGDLEEFEAGYDEFLKKLSEDGEITSKAEANKEESLDRIDKYISENKLDEERAMALVQGLDNLIGDLHMGVVSDEIIDLVYKGLNYDKDIEEVAETAFVEGKNDAVDAKMKGKTEKGSIPDLGHIGGKGIVKKTPLPRKKDWTQNIKELNV